MIEKFFMDTIFDSTFKKSVCFASFILIPIIWYIKRCVTEETESTEDSENEEREKDEKMKMTLVVRRDLKMGRGKAAAQCAHAAVGAYEKALATKPLILQAWKRGGQRKVVVQVDSEEQLLKLAVTAKQHSLSACLVRDAGRTQIAPNSVTVLAIGPDTDDNIDPVAGYLKLY